jgi:CHAT domain-containing protein/Tfp pilus assembly protein PilF
VIRLRYPLPHREVCTVKRVLLCLLLPALLAATARGHEFPTPTRAGIEALLDLTDRCVKAGGLKAVKHPRTGEPYYAVADPAKLREAVAARHKQLTPGLRDTLIGGWQALDTWEEPYAIALLRAIGAETSDDRALAFAAAFQAKRDERSRQHRAALRSYADAERLFQASGDRGWQATMLNDSGVLLRELGDLAGALDHYQQALKLRRAVYGPGHEVVATCLNNIGIVLEQQGKPDDALKHHLEALAIRRRSFKSPHRLIGRSLINVGTSRTALRQYDQALKALGEALDNLRRPGDRDLIAEALNDMGGAHELRGDYDQALYHYRQAGDLWLEVHGTLRHPDVLVAMNNLGNIHFRRGDFARAAVFLEVTVKVRRELYPGDHPDTARSLDNLALAYLRLGDLGPALDRSRQALDMRRRLYPGAHPDVARSLNNRAAIHSARGEYAEAAGDYRQALAMWRTVHAGRPHPDIAICLDNLAVLAYRQGNTERALRDGRQAAEQFRELFPAGHPDLAGALGSQGQYLSDLGRFDEALHALDEAVAALGTRPGGQLPPADRLAPDDLRHLPETVKVLHLHGLAAEKHLGDGGTARDWLACARTYTLAAQVLERVRRGVSEGGRLQVGEETFDLFPRLVGVRRRLFALECKPEHLEAAFTAAEEGIARRFLEMLGQSRAHVVGGVPEGLRRQEADLQQRLEDLDQLINREQGRPAEERDPEALARLFDQQRQAEAELQKLTRRLEKDYPGYARLLYPRPCAPEEARACLRPNEVALVYLPGSEASYVVLLDREPGQDDMGKGLAVYPLPPAQEMAGVIGTLTDPETLTLPDEAREQGARAYRMLLAPLAGRIKGKDLVIVPGGALGLLPFELLVEPASGDEDGNFLIEGHRIRYAPSLTLLHLLRRWEATRSRPRSVLWAVGDPVYEKSDPRLRGKGDLDRVSLEALAGYLGRGGEGETLRRLKYSGQEVRDVAEALGTPAANVLTGLGATEAAVKTASRAGRLADARYVHFATHGILGVDQGRQPALVLSLAGNNGREEGDGVNDGLLRMDEVMGLRLNADLVMLSACRTGRGQLYRAEGVVGLSRAFLYAGSRGVVCSLWSVEDRQTARLMVQTYRGLRDGQPAAHALREAKRTLIKSGKAPFYWAPFVLIGE